MIRRMRWVLLGLISLAFAINFVDRQTLSLLAPFLKRDYHWTNTDYAAIVIAFRAAYSIGQTLCGRLMDRVGTKRILYPSLVLIPVAFALLAVANQRWEMILSAILFGLGFGAAYPAFATFILANTDPERRARTFGSIVWAFDTGIATGSLVIGSLGDAFGFKDAFLTAAAVSCFSIPIFSWSSRALAARGTSLAEAVPHAGSE